jgi:hypothetical protein
MDHIPDAATLRQIWSQHPLALVKQSLYDDLYCCASQSDPVEAVRSSLRRTGPMGFLVDLAAEFFMVREDSAPECGIWQESVCGDPLTRQQNFEEKRRLEKKVPWQGKRGHSRSPWQMAIQAKELDWGKYSMVISLDIAIPLGLRLQHPNVLWVYFPTDPGTPTAKRARRRPPEGFSVSLTHTHRRFPVRPGLSSLAIECPYSFQSSFSWNQVWPREKERRGVMVEHQTLGLLDPGQTKQLEEFGPVRRPQGSVSEVATALRASKYYLRLQGGPLSGNGQVEAVMAGCLALGNPQTYVQRSLFTPATVTPDFNQARDRIRFFESNPKEFEIAQADQLAVAEFVCFRRPAYHLWCHLKRYQQDP